MQFSAPVVVVMVFLWVTYCCCYCSVHLHSDLVTCVIAASQSLMVSLWDVCRKGCMLEELPLCCSVFCHPHFFMPAVLSEYSASEGRKCEYLTFLFSPTQQSSVWILPELFKICLRLISQLTACISSVTSLKSANGFCLLTTVLESPI